MEASLAWPLLTPVELFCVEATGGCVQGGFRKDVGKEDLHGRRRFMSGDEKVIMNLQWELMILSITFNY